MDIFLNTLYTTSYVGSLFVLPSARTGGKRVDPATGRPLTRDSPNVLRARLTGVGLSSIASLGAAAYVASVVLRPGSAVSGIQFDGLKRVPTFVDARRIAELLGLWKPSIQSGKQLVRLVAYPLACTMSLFLGPLYTSALDRRLPGMSAFSWKHDFLSIFTSLRGLRNYVIGPITEELVFRSCIVGTAALYGRSTKHLILVTPLYFGIAHAHHAYEVYANGGRTRRSLQQGVFSALFQTVYTSLFGFHAAFLFLRTGSVLPPILSHVFCNLMGFPQLTDAIQQRPAQKWIIIGAYLAGIAAFVKTLMPLTEPALFGGSALW